MDTEEMRLDGNAAGGALAAVFGTEMTASLRTCASCRTTRAVGQHLAYSHAAGLVLRCPECGDVALTLVEGPTHVTLTLRGALRISLD